MPLPAALTGAAALIDVGAGIANIFGARRAEREAEQRRQRLLRLARAKDEAEEARYNRVYGRTLDELGDYMSGTEGGAGRLSRVSTEQRMAEGTLRSLEGDLGRTEQGRRRAVDRNLASRGVTGGAAAGALAELEADIAATRSDVASRAVEGSRAQRLQFASTAPQRVGGRELAVLEGTVNPYQAQADARGIGEGLEALSLLWDESKRSRRRRDVTGGVPPAARPD